MQNYYNVFISSTSEDLKAHRQAVLDNLPLDAVHAVNMEGFNATKRNALQLCYDELQRAALFIGIYAFRYGFVPDDKMTYTDTDDNLRRGNGKTSITEWEYEWAIEKGIPICLFIAETEKWIIAYYDKDQTALDAFKKRISVKHVYGKFDDQPSNLVIEVNKAVNKFLREKMKPSPKLAEQQEKDAILKQQASYDSPKSPSRYVGRLPRLFRAKKDPFHDRIHEQARLKEAITNHERVVTIHGRGGVGKTGLVCYVLEELEQTAGAVDGMVYHSLQNDKIITISEIVDNFRRIIPDLDVSAGDTPEEQITALCDALYTGHYVLLLDNLETVQDPISHQIIEPSVKLLVETVLQEGGLTLLITTRYPFPIDNYVLSAHHHKIKLEEGLPLEDARQLMRNLNGNEFLPTNDTELDYFIEKVQGFPRALEAGMGWLNEGYGQRKLLDLLENVIQWNSVTELIVGTVIDALSVKLRQVMEALAVCQEPASYDLLEYLLAPYRDMTVYPLHDALDRLIASHFVIISGGRYGLHPLDREHCLNALPKENDYYSKIALNQRAIEYYKARRKPQSEWQTIEDLQPQLIEFEHWLALEDYDTALTLLISFDFNYLISWGYIELTCDYHLRLKGKIFDKNLQGNNLAKIGIAHYYLGNNRTSIRYYYRALKIFQSLGNQQGEGMVLGGLGMAYIGLRELNRVIKYYEKALNIARIIGDKRAEGNRLGNLGTAYSDIGDINKAIEYYQKSLSISQSMDDKFSEGASLGNLGIAYYNLGDLLTSIKYHKLSLETSITSGDRYGEGLDLSNLGFMQICLGQIKEGLNNIYKSGVILLDVKAKRHLQYQLVYLTQGHLLNQDNLSADQSITQALLYDVPENNHTTYTIAGIVYFRMGEIEQAQKAFEQTIKLSNDLLSKTSNFYKALYTRACAQVGLALIHNKELDEARDDYRLALSICSADGVRDDALRWLDFLRPVDIHGALEVVRQDIRNGYSDRGMLCL